jgi:hypothetical protein
MVKVRVVDGGSPLRRSCVSNTILIKKGMRVNELRPASVNLLP